MSVVLVIFAVLALALVWRLQSDEGNSPVRPGQSSSDTSVSGDEAIILENGVDRPLGSVDKSSNSEKRIAEAIAEKNGWDQNNLAIKIMQQNGHYYAGSIGFNDSSGGGLFYAVDNNGDMTIVFDGNGAPMCSEVERYEFPSRMVPECYDDASDSVINRQK